MKEIQEDDKEETDILIKQDELEPADKEKEKGKGKQKSRLFSVGVLAIVLYGVTSLVQTVFNKKVLATYDFHGSNILMLFQLCLSSSALFLGRCLGIAKFPPPNVETATKILPLSICYISSVLLALLSLPTLSLAMYSALKRLVALMILVCEYYVLKKQSPTSIWLSVGVMISGAIVAGASDLSFDFYGYVFALSSSFFQALYMVLVKKLATDIGPVEMLFYNSTLSIPFVFVIVYSLDEFWYMMNFSLFSDIGFRLYFTMSLFLGAFLNFFIFFCTSVNSPLTTSVTGQAKNILTTILGVMIFNDLIIRPANVIGLCMNASGGIWYAWLKLRNGGGGGG